VYFYSLANELGVDTIHDQMEPLGFGRLTGIDLMGEVKGILPSTDWKRRAYKRPEQKRWFAGETISLGIGQGYNSFTMVQMASALSALVSDGQRFQPRLVREVEDVVLREKRLIANQALPRLLLNPEHTEFIRSAMYGVTQEGTSTRVFVGAPYMSGGKTGTAQAVTLKQNEKYNASRMDEYERDHSLYEAFAPVEQPRVALAVIVENAGFGAEAAAPIARRVLDYLLAGIYPSEEDIAAVQQGKAAAPIGTPRKVSEVPLPKGLDVFGTDVPVSPPTIPVSPLAPSAPSAPSAPTPSAPGPSAPVVPQPPASIASKP